MHDIPAASKRLTTTRPLLSPIASLAGGILGVAAIFIATLVPAGAADRMNSPFFCILCGAAPVAAVLRNIILFLPFGFFGYGLRRSLVIVTLAGAGVSGGVELLQAGIPGRNPALGDLLANTTGAALGGLLASALAVTKSSGNATRWHLFVAVLVAAFVAAAAPGALLVPTPPDEGLFVHWNYQDGMSSAGGKIIDARLGDLPLPPGRLPDGSGAATRLRGGHSLILTLRAGTSLSSTRGLFRVVQGPTGREFLTLRMIGDDLSATFAARAERLGLTRPQAVASGILKGVESGDVMTVTLAIRESGVVAIGVPGRSWRVSLNDPSLGWSLLYHPPGIGESGKAFLGFLWCAGLLFAPTGLAPTRRHALMTTAGLLLLLGLHPSVVAFQGDLSLLSWTGAAIGATTGIMVSNRARAGGG